MGVPCTYISKIDMEQKLALRQNVWSSNSEELICSALTTQYIICIYKTVHGWKVHSISVHVHP